MENDASNNSFVVACVLIAAVTCNRDDDDNIKNVDFI
jgi:hypothetical protein